MGGVSRGGREIGVYCFKQDYGVFNNVQYSCEGIDSKQGGFEFR